MRRFPEALRRTLSGTARLANVAGRRQRRSAVLGAVLLVVSTATVWATSNTPPLFTSLTASASVINEGQTVTLSGTFTDPDVGDFHSVRIHWGREPTECPCPKAEQIQLPPGQFSFQVTHTYPDNLSPTYISAIVYDRQTPPGTDPNDNTDHYLHDGRAVPIQVKNVAPRFVNSSITVSKGPDFGVVVEGDVVDPGTGDSEQVTANWGDPNAPGTTACTLAKGERHFRCEHAYHAAIGSKTYPISLLVKDDDGGQGTFQTSVQIP